MHKYDLFSAFCINNNKRGFKTNISKYDILSTKLPFLNIDQFRKDPMLNCNKIKSKNTRFTNLSLSIENNNNFLKTQDKKLTFNSKSSTRLKFGNCSNLTNYIKMLSNSPTKTNNENLLYSGSDQNLLFSFKKAKNAKPLSKISDRQSISSYTENILPKKNRQIFHFTMMHFLNSNKENTIKNKDNNKYSLKKTKNKIAPNFMLIDEKLKKKYLYLANEFKKENSCEKVNETIKSNSAKNISGESSFTECDDYNLQKNIIEQKILVEERKKEKARSNLNSISQKQIEFFGKFLINKKKNQLTKLNVLKRNDISLTKFIKAYNRYFTQKELYNNQKIRMNSLRAKYINQRNKENL